MYGKRIPSEDPPCEECKPIVLNENEDALNIFLVTRYQLVMGFNGPIDICHHAIHENMKLYKIKNRRECFEKVTMLSKYWIKKIKEE